MKLSFFNTMNRRQEEFIPLNSNKVGMYTCGPTVYNFAHIGNFRAYIFEDLLRRVIKYAGYEMLQVMNLTDVDDKTIRDSQAASKSLDDFTTVYKQAFFTDLAELKIEPAEVYPAATEHISEMIELIQTLIDKEFGYQADDGSVYFSIGKFPEYGKLAKIDLENQRSGVRIKNDEYAKDSVADFALWKAWDKADGDVCWESPWGKGRPGWHIECSAMSMKYLGKTFDIHTGGIDNMFPHHEDEIAQSESANDCRYVNYWLHCAHLIVDGEKMSKSAGNFFTLHYLKEKGFTGREIRWVLLGTHYRKKLNFTLEFCEQARAALKKFSDLFNRLRDVARATGSDATTIVATAKHDFSDALGDDLNISKALAAIFALQRETNILLDSANISCSGAEAVLEQFRDFDRIFNLFEVDCLVDEFPPAVVELAEKRQLARQERDFAASDALRDELAVLGWIIEDSPDGYRLKLS
jgi:cysteinyl-tRNA synthetase